MIKHLTLPKKMAAMVLLAGAALSIAPVQAASYPTKQIELVVLMPPEAVRIWLPVPLLMPPKTIYPSASGLSINLAEAVLSA